ncbi:MAG: tetratricopeptide repeat protein [Thermodesulfobacteriota bacterium]
MEIVERLVDALTPMYQDVIDRLLNRGQAAVLEMLAANGGVGRAKDIAESTFQDEQTVRTFLGNLCDLGLAVRSPGLDLPGQARKEPSREVYYRLHPPLFQIWYEMRHLGRKQGLYLVRFFSLLTEPDEARRSVTELKRPEAPVTAQRLVHLMEEVADLLDEDWKAISDEFVRDPLRKGGTLRTSLEALDKAIYEVNEEQVNRCIGLHVIRGDVRSRLGDTKGAFADLETALRLVAEINDTETIVKVKCATSSLSDEMGQARRALELAEEAASLSPSITSPRRDALQGIALASLAAAHASLSDYSNAIEEAKRAIALAEQEGSSSLLARGIQILANCHLSKGEFTESRAHGERALAIRQEIGDRSGEAASLNNLGNVFRSTGDYARAREYYEKSLAIQQEIGDRSGEAHSLGNLGGVSFSTGEYGRARACFEKSLAIRQEIGDRSGEANSLNNLGGVSFSTGEYGRARAYFERSLAIQQEIGDRSGEANSLNNLGNVFRFTGDYGHACDYFAKSLAIRQEIGDRSGEANSLNNLGNVFRFTGDYGHACDYFAKSLAIRQEIGDRYGEAESLNNLGNVFSSNGDYGRAREYYEKSLAIKQEIGDRYGEAASLNNLGNVFRSTGDYGRAREYYEKSLAIRQEIGDRSGEAASVSSLGSILLQEKKASAALDLFLRAHRIFTTIGERENVKISASGITSATFQQATDEIRSHNQPAAHSHIRFSLQFIDDIGADVVISRFLTILLTPLLQVSREYSEHIFPLFELICNLEVVKAHRPVCRAIEALLRFYKEDRSQKELESLGPVETTIVRSLFDQIERPDHVKARELLEAGKANEATVVLEGILERSSEDIEAVLNLASALTAQGRHDDALKRLDTLLEKQKDLPHALFLKAKILAEKGQGEPAMEILRSLISSERPFMEAFPLAAQLLRQQRRFEELVPVFKTWDLRIEDQDLRQALKIWLPEALILSGDLAGAKIAMPAEGSLPKESQIALLLMILRVFLALTDRDATKARSWAAKALEFAADLPPGKAIQPVSADLAAVARQTLGEREAQFFLALGFALGQRLDPMQFAAEFLSEEEAGNLVERISQEKELALEALRSGKIQAFEDLARITNRTIGPAAGIEALGGAFRELGDRQKGILLDVFTVAVRHGTPAEVAAALRAIGKNFPSLEPIRRGQCLAAILDLANQPQAELASREHSIRAVNVLYPHLQDTERQEVRRALEGIRNEINIPAIKEFFEKTIVRAETGAKP